MIGKLSALAKAAGVLSMNRRNADFIYRLNKRRDYPVADDKLLAKEAMIAAGVLTSPTLTVFRSFYELAKVETRLAPFEDFAVKPAHGRAGGGILIVTGREGCDFITTNGKKLNCDEFRRHLANIIFGIYSLDVEDAAIVEPRLQPHPFFARLYPHGIADIRVIVVSDQPVLSMIRLPTRESAGRANLHQGAIGLGLDLATGDVVRAWHHHRVIETHPDTGARLVGLQVPDFEKVIDLARRAAKAVALKYLGVDIVIDRELGALVLEINVRPGLEIQNVTGVPLYSRLVEMGLA
jgi:alpha-L-glutamate ligase-like protein